LQINKSLKGSEILNYATVKHTLEALLQMYNELPISAVFVGTATLFAAHVNSLFQNYH